MRLHLTRFAPFTLAVLLLTSGCDRQPEPAGGPPPITPIDPNRGLIGFEYDLHPNEKLTSRPVVITAILPDCPADRGGLRPGDAVLSVDGHEIHGIDDLRERFPDWKPGEFTEFVVQRGDKPFNVKILLMSAREFAEAQKRAGGRMLRDP